MLLKIGQENAEKQLTKSFQNINEVLPLKQEEPIKSVDNDQQSAKDAQVVQQIKNSLIQAGTETDKQRQSNKQQTYSVQTKERVGMNSHPPRRKQPSASVSRNGKQ